MSERRPTIDTKARILDVAQDLIQRHGLNAMSFQDLSDAVGIRKASVHHHFASKDVMVNALLERYVADFDKVVQSISTSRASGKTKLKRFCGLFVETLEAGKHEKSCLCGMLAAEMLSLDDEGLELVRRFMRRSVGHIGEMIEAGVNDGSLAEQNDVAGTAEMVLSTLEGGLLVARCDGGPKQLAGVVGRLVMLLSAG
ncbi:MAG: TetR/AcrR family transcriptional regulator [Planctomycetales bacterium]|nr:TetR/AcrR family transcriptional regulator [Planctomycetales bacterium]